MFMERSFPKTDEGYNPECISAVTYDLHYKG